MKNWGIWCLMILCALFLGLMAGYAMGSSRTQGDLLFSGIPTEIHPTKPTETSDPLSAYPVNINTASVEQLQTLPGIGPTLAQAIVDYREANGAFLRPEELGNVSGIGEKKLSEILELITTGG